MKITKMQSEEIQTKKIKYGSSTGKNTENLKK